MFRDSDCAQVSAITPQLVSSQRAAWQPRARLAEIAAERAWDQFHNPKNLAPAARSSELVEHFQWLSLAQGADLPRKTRQELALECAQVLLFLLRLSDTLDIEIELG